MSSSIPTELNLSHAKQFESVLTFLEHHLPSSIISWQLLKYIQQNIITQNDIYLQLFVNNPDEIKCVILLYSTPGLSDENAVKIHTRNVGVVYEKDAPTYVLMSMLEKCIPWTQKLVLVGIDSRYVTPLIERFIQTKQNGKHDISSYDLLQIDRSALDKARTNLSPIPEGYAIRPLAWEDATLLIDTWGDTSFDYYSLTQVQFCINRLPTLGAYHQDKLVCWRITHYDGSSEMAFTLPEARRLGLSYQIGVRLASEVCKIQQGSFGYVAHGNQASLAMVSKMGYRVTYKSDWIEFEPNILRNEQAVNNSRRQTKIDLPLKLKSSI